MKKGGSGGEHPSDEVLYGQQGLMMKGGSGVGRGGFRDDFWSRFGSDLAIAIRHEMGAN